jgi:hypothetical protein
LLKASEWIEQNEEDCFQHDQTLMHVGSLIGKWKSLNLCKPPHHWLSSWAGHYNNTLELIHKLSHGSSISHLHYSGGKTGSFVNPIDELLLANNDPRERLKVQLMASARELLGLNAVICISTKINRNIQIILRRLT